HVRGGHQDEHGRLARNLDCILCFFLKFRLEFEDEMFEINVDFRGVRKLIELVDLPVWIIGDEIRKRSLCGVASGPHRDRDHGIKSKLGEVRNILGAQLHLARRRDECPDQAKPTKPSGTDASAADIWEVNTLSITYSEVFYLPISIH